MNKECNTNIKHIDQTVSVNLRKRRIELGLTQKEVSRIIGVSVQQLQKYEKSISRISSGKLNTLAVFLKKPVNYFFYQDEEDVNCNYVVSEDEKLISSLIKAFNNIQNYKIKTKVIKFVKSMSYE